MPELFRSGAFHLRRYTNVLLLLLFLLALDINILTYLLTYLLLV